MFTENQPDVLELVRLLRRRFQIPDATAREVAQQSQNAFQKNDFVALCRMDFLLCSVFQIEKFGEYLQAVTLLYEFWKNLKKGE